MVTCLNWHLNSPLVSTLIPFSYFHIFTKRVWTDYFQFPVVNWDCSTCRLSFSFVVFFCWQILLYYQFLLYTIKVTANIITWFSVTLLQISFPDVLIHFFFPIYFRNHFRCFSCLNWILLSSTDLVWLVYFK